MGGRGIFQGEPRDGGGFIPENLGGDIRMIDEGLEHPGVAELHGLGRENGVAERIGIAGFTAPPGEILDIIAGQFADFDAADIG